MNLLILACSAPSLDEDVPADPLTASALAAATAALTDLGPRMVTTDAESAAADLIEQALLEAGLDSVERVPFVWDAWLPGAASVTVDGVAYAAEPLSPSPPTTALTGTLAMSDFSGQIALFSSDDGSRAEQFLAALTGGAAAMIRISEQTGDSGEPLVEVGHTLQGSTLPAVAVSAAVGAILKTAGEVQIDIDSTTVFDHTSENIAGIVDGASTATVAITAHFDSWHPAESAADNALGAAMLELLALRVAQEQPERRVLLLATSGEEQGL